MTVLKVLVALGLLYLVYCGGLFLIQRHVMYPGKGIRLPGPPELPPGVERVWLNTASGRVEAWLLPGEGGAGQPGPALIFAHGNGELIDFYAERFSELSRRGLHVFLVEYPGYGRSEGTPSQESITEAFVQAYDFLAARPEVDSGRIVFWGRSLGGGAVCALLGERPAAALILLSTFTSVRAIANRMLVPSFLVRDPFDNLAVVAKYHGPVLIAHGKSDGVIPYGHAGKLHAAASASHLLTYPSGHNDCPPDWDEFFDEMEAFLREAGVLIAPQ